MNKIILNKNIDWNQYILDSSWWVYGHYLFNQRENSYYESMSKLKFEMVRNLAKELFNKRICDISREDFQFFSNKIDCVITDAMGILNVMTQDEVFQMEVDKTTFNMWVEYKKFVEGLD